MNARQLPLTDYRALKAATRDLTRLLTTTGAAAVTRVSQQTLSTYGSPNEDFAATFMPIDVVADLEAELGDAPVTRALAQMAGGLYVPLPAGTGRWDIEQLAGVSAREFGDVLTKLGKSLADGKLDSAERAALRPEIGEAILALVQLDHVVAAEGGGE